MNRKQNIRGSRTSDISNNDRQRTKEENMWSIMLDSVASGKKLPEKNILVLGGNPESQKEFLEMLDSDLPKRQQERNRRKPPIANEFALGYTYQDVLDADQEDILARLSIYLLAEPSPAFAPLLRPKLNPRTVPDTLIVILLDWTEPWSWVRQLRNWIAFLRGIISTLDEETKDIMEATMKDWQKRRRGGSAYEASSGTTSNEGNVGIPLSQGEWDEGLGLPLCVVCHSADRIDILEKEQGWREEEFDFVLQFLRTILAKHGASLIYTSVSVPNSLPTMIHSTLGIHSLLKKQSLKHNVIDRDRILIPPNWDSWGKIRVLREGFDVDGISQGWSIDIQQPAPVVPNPGTEGSGAQTLPQNEDERGERNRVVHIYEDTIRDPRRESISDLNGKKLGVDIEVIKNQDFLATQLEIMERLKLEEDKTSEKNQSTIMSDPAIGGKAGKPPFHDNRPVTDHIGPVQYNTGGIQVDSDGMMNTSRDDEAKPADKGAPTPGTPGTPDGKAQNEALAVFFAGLMKRGGAHSPKTTST